MPDAHTSARDAGVYRLSFVMPAKYTIDTLPRPNNARVQIKEVAPKYVYATEYTIALSAEPEQISYAYTSTIMYAHNLFFSVSSV